MNLLAGKQQRSAVVPRLKKQVFRSHSVIFLTHRTFLPSVSCLTTQKSRLWTQMSRVYTAHCHRCKAERGYIHSLCRKTQKKETGLTQASFFLVCDKKKTVCCLWHTESVRVHVRPHGVKRTYAVPGLRHVVEMHM